MFYTYDELKKDYDDFYNSLDDDDKYRFTQDSWISFEFHVLSYMKKGDTAFLDEKEHEFYLNIDHKYYYKGYDKLDKYAKIQGIEEGILVYSVNHNKKLTHISVESFFKNFETLEQRRKRKIENMFRTKKPSF